jgi:hypothetical protein
MTACLHLEGTVRDSLHTPPFMLFMPTSPFTLTVFYLKQKKSIEPKSAVMAVVV